MSKRARDPLAKAIGSRLLAARESMGLTQKETAERLKITQAAYCSYELGNSMLPVEILLRLPGALSRPITYFLGLPDELGLTDEDRELLSTYKSIEAPGLRRMVREIAKSSYEHNRDDRDRRAAEKRKQR